MAPSIKDDELAQEGLVASLGSVEVDASWNSIPPGGSQIPGQVVAKRLPQREHTPPAQVIHHKAHPRFAEVTGQGKFAAHRVWADDTKWRTADVIGSKLRGSLVHGELCNT